MVIHVDGGTAGVAPDNLDLSISRHDEPPAGHRLQGGHQLPALEAAKEPTERLAISRPDLSRLHLAVLEIERVERDLRAMHVKPKEDRHSLPPARRLTQAGSSRRSRTAAPHAIFPHGIGAAAARCSAAQVRETARKPRRRPLQRASACAAAGDNGLQWPHGMAVVDKGRTLVVPTERPAARRPLRHRRDETLHGPRGWAALEPALDGICTDADGAVWVAPAFRQALRTPARGWRAARHVGRRSRVSACWAVQTVGRSSSPAPKLARDGGGYERRGGTGRLLALPSTAHRQP